ncbi:hypothetical protein [Hymenobacter fastidiosus]
MEILPTVQAKANDAILLHLGSWLDEKRGAAIQAEYGFATYCFGQEAYRFSVDYPVDWSVTTYSEAIASVQQALRVAYPFLKEESIRRLSSCFSYAWK